MKTIKNTLAILIVLSFSFYIGCKGTDDPITEVDPLAERLEELMNGGTTWAINNVTKDGYDVTDQFTGFTLTVGKFTYTTANGLSSAWASSGTWDFNNSSPNVIMRDDGTLINVTLSATQLTLSFAVSGLSGGRTEGVDGDYVFILE